MARFIKNKLCILVIAAIMISISGCGSGSVSTDNAIKDGRVQKWIEDIDYLHKKLPEVHKNIYHSLKKEEFDKEIQDLKNDVANLKDYEIKCRLAQIVASVGDAHTSLNLGFNNSSIYPLQLWWFGSDLRVVSTDQAHEDILGKKLISINGISIDEIMKKIDSLISHENDQWLKVINVEYAVMPDVLKLIGVTTEDKVELAMEDDNSSISKVELYPGSLSNGNIVRVMDTMPVKPVRLQFDQFDLTQNLYWYKYIPRDKILYFQYNHCIDRGVAKRYGYSDYEKYPDFEKFSEGLIKTINDNNIDKFIVDLRNNTGGDSSLMTELVGKLSNIDKLRGKIYVIIGRETMSSGVLAAVDFMDKTKAIFYGEPTGGNVNGYGEVKTLVLPNSKLQISYSTKYFGLSDKFKENFVPDVSVDQSYADYAKGIDDVYESIKNCKN